MPQLDKIFYLYLFLISFLGFILFQIIFLIYIIYDYYLVLRIRFLIYLNLSNLSLNINYIKSFINLKKLF